MRNQSYRHRGRHSKKKIPGIKPSVDGRLKPIFSQIGIPEKAPFKPDRFQLEALSAIEVSDCLVTAPTGSGKTWIAEKTIRRIYENNGKAWYASPLKALSNSIYAGFSEKFGKGKVGILTGDRKENPDAPIIIGTTEILRNHLYDAMHQGEDLETDIVILDEAHFLGDEDRGVVWEEIMIYLPSRVPILMLSATIGNARQIAEWLKSIRHRECVVIEENQRPVPLYPLFFHPDGMLLPLLSGKSSDSKSVIYKKVVSHIPNRNKLLPASPGKLPPMGAIIRVLRKYHLLPVIFFMKSRRDCDNAINLCSVDNSPDSTDMKKKRSERIEALLGENHYIRNHKQLWQLEHMGVASHHSGQLPAWKIVIETLMTEGLLDAVFATSTVAAGVNFPARAVGILNSDRFNGIEFRPLTPTEFHQMTGRAGRRGMDNIGFVVILPGKFMDLRLVARLIRSASSNVYSQIKINFSMVLNLLLSHTPNQIEELLEKSFTAYQLLQSRKNKHFFMQDKKYLWRDFQQHLNFLKEKEYVTESDELTDDGRWASKLRIDHPLLIAESFRLGIVPESDPAMLAALVASFVNEREDADENLSTQLIPKMLLKQFLVVKKSLRPFAKQMRSRGFEAKSLCIRPAAAIYSWALENSWDTVLEISGLAEGDLARLILRTSDNLRHIRNLTQVFPKVAATSGKSIEMLLRDPLV